jgi:hypothetical protein
MTPRIATRPGSPRRKLQRQEPTARPGPSRSALGISQSAIRAELKRQLGPRIDCGNADGGGPERSTGSRQTSASCSSSGYRSTAVGEMVTAASEAIPFDASDLPGYAAAMFDRFRTEVHMTRLSDWYRLEHGKPGPYGAAWAAQRGRPAAIAKAQQDKVISDRLEPQELLGVITALARMGAKEFTYLNPPSSITAARAAVHDIVKQLVVQP